jgi:hypothetical protein
MIVPRATLLLSLMLSIAAPGNGRAAEPSGTAPPASSTGFTLCTSTYALCTDADCTPGQLHERHYFVGDGSGHRTHRPLYKRPEIMAAVYAERAQKPQPVIHPVPADQQPVRSPKGFKPRSIGHPVNEK